MIKLDNRCKTIDFKFDDSFGGLATISLLTIKEGEMTTAQATIRTAAPDKKLDIKASSFRDKLLPGSLENWTFSITDTEGNPVSARFMTEIVYDFAESSYLPDRKLHRVSQLRIAVVR